MSNQMRTPLLAIWALGSLAIVLTAWLWPGRWVLLAVLLVLQGLAVLWFMRRHEQELHESERSLEQLASLDTTLRISDETMPYLRQGLNFESAQKITDIIQQIADVDAVAITDTEKILGFTGVGCRRHRQGGPILTEGTRFVLNTGQPFVHNNAQMLSCDEKSCPHPLRAAVVTPLKYRGRIVGTFKLYRTSPQPMPPMLTRLAMSVAHLLSIQMEIGEADRQKELATKARLEALQAQIRPHFLFNVLNTIISVSRTDVPRAQELLVQLAQFFRRSVRSPGQFLTLAEEIEYVQNYLNLEKARYGEKLEVRIKIDPRALNVPIPVLTVQPLVENAVMHGLAPQEEGGLVAIRAGVVGGHVTVTILDTGVGISLARQQAIFAPGEGAGLGIGLSNVNERLISLYGEEYRLRVRSRPGRGTVIRFRIPIGDGTAATADSLQMAGA